jgi:hypothetical protein
VGQELSDGFNDRRGGDGDCLVESREQGSAGDWQCEDLGVGLGDGGFSDLFTSLGWIR